MPYVLKQRIEFLAEASKILSSSLDYNVTLSSVANLLVANVADFCMVDIFINKKLNRFVVKLADPKKRYLEKKMFDFPPDPTNKNAIYDAAKSWEPIIVRTINDKWINQVSKIPEEIEVTKQLGIKSIIFAPMISRDKVIGVLTIASSKKGFHYKSDDAVFIKELATRIGLAIDNARLFSEAKEALRTRDEFLSIASHELKTPLTAILLNLQIVLHKIHKTKTNIPEIDSIIKMVEVSKQQTQRMARMVSDLLNVSVVSTGRLKIEPEKVELGELIENTIERFESQLNTSKVKVSFAKKEKVIGNWDRIRLEQVISNLISNGIKYGERRPIEINYWKNDKKAFISVKDKGIGISKKSQELIFDRFKRAVAGKKYRGLGVGLYISQQIVHAHKGKLKVKSEIGHGSEFVIELPLNKI